MFIGRPQLLEPGEKKVLVVDALVDYQCHLVFSNQFKRLSSDGFQEFKARIKLPADYPLNSADLKGEIAD